MTYRQLIKYPRVTILSEPAYDISIQLQQPSPDVLMTFVHVDIYAPTAGTLKSLLQQWPAVRASLPPIVFCHGHSDDPMFHRFVTRFGWKPISSTPCSDGKTRRIYAHYLKGHPDGRRT